MWEYCISFEDKNSADIFSNSIYNEIKSHGGIITTRDGDCFYKVLIALPIIERFKVHNVIKEKIAETILLCIKSEYILSRLDFETNNASPSMKVFLKALIVFDSDTDKDIIVERLNFDSDLVVKSFVNFRMSFLKRKWNELVSLANDNAMYLLSQDSFDELIKFLISNLEYRCYAVNVFSKKDCYFLCDMKGEVVKDFLIDKNIMYDDSNLLVNLVALNPEKIIVHCNNNIKDNLLKTLYEYFSNRIELCK